MGEEEEAPVRMKRYEEVAGLQRVSAEVREVPKICPLINSCEQIRADKSEYKQLVQKWSAYAQSQEAEEFEIREKTRRLGREGKKTEKVTLTKAQPVTGTQVFYLEYRNNPEYKDNPQAKQTRFERMCPHFKKDTLGLPVSDPPYHDCTIFSEWFYSKQRK